MEELSHGFANVRNVVPDGIDVVPWGNDRLHPAGAAMSRDMLVELTGFLKEIGEHTKKTTRPSCWTERDHLQLLLRTGGIPPSSIRWNTPPKSG